MAATLTWVKWSPDSTFGDLDPMYAHAVVQGEVPALWRSSYDDANYLRARWEPRFRLGNDRQSSMLHMGPTRASRWLLDLFLSFLQGESFQNQEFVEHFWGAPLEEITIQTIERFVHSQSIRYNVAGVSLREELANRIMLLRACGFRTIRDWHTHRLLVRSERLAPVDQARRLGLRVVFPDELLANRAVISIDMES